MDVAPHVTYALVRDRVKYNPSVVRVKFGASTVRDIVRFRART